MGVWSGDKLFYLIITPTTIIAQLNLVVIMRLFYVYVMHLIEQTLNDKEKANFVC